MDLPFEILSAADICSRTGQNLLERYKQTRGANRDLDGFGVRMEHVWMDIASRLPTVHSSPGAVPHDLRLCMEELLYQLLYHLHTSYKNLEKTVDSNGRAATKTIKFALFQKRLLKKDVSALEKWRDKFGSTFPTLSISQSPGSESVR
ncbi:hypothetical protein HOY82DRAFT_642053 [Tuber indicum]|nr:hypothetical protein HOY82DRAFT_642053 [Tuber indicum]